MATTRVRSVEVVPNVLQDQTVPNTLGGVGPPLAVGPRRPSRRVLVVACAAIAAVLALVVARSA